MLACSFCGKDESKVTKLVAGPNVYICDSCVAIADAIMRSDGRQQSVLHRLLRYVRKMLPFTL
jgi:ATP-dependent Clp protease ATP-binding subunit ClpX